MGSWEYKEHWLHDRPLIDWLDVQHANFIAQPYPLQQLRRGVDPRAPATSWFRWPIVHADCYDFKRTFAAEPTAMVYVVFARPGAAEAFHELPRDSLCLQAVPP